MPMNVTVDPDMTLLIFSESFEKILDEVDFWVKLKVWIDPLSVQIDACNGVSIVTTDDTIRI